MFIKGTGENEGIGIMSAGSEELSFLGALVSEVEEKYFKNGRPTMDEIEQSIKREEILIVLIKSEKLQEIINIGCCWLCEIDEKNKNVVVGILLAKQY